MQPRSFHIIAGISAMLFLVTLGLYIHGLWVVERYYSPVGTYVSSESGVDFRHGDIRIRTGTLLWGAKNSSVRVSSFVVPVWIPLVTTSIYPAIWCLLWYFRYRWHRRRKLGLCPRCGYDVRASQDRCSECGETLSTSLKNVDSRQNPI